MPASKAGHVIFMLALLISWKSIFVPCCSLAAPGRDLSASYFYSNRKRPSKSSEEYVDDYDDYDDSNSGERGGPSQNFNDPSSVGAAIWEFLGETLRKGNRGGTTNVNYAPKFGPTFNKIVINKEGSEAPDPEKTAGGDNLDNIDGVEAPIRAKVPVAKKVG